MRYKQASAFYVANNRSDEEREVMALVNEYAALRDEPASSAAKRALREALPGMISELKRQRKRKSA
jgi:hypothetical protein